MMEPLPEWGNTRQILTYLLPALILGGVRDEVISPISIAGAGLVIVGAFLASRRETRAR
jgi:drug/metabolite transporter (DMT)-like permease